MTQLKGFQERSSMPIPPNDRSPNFIASIENEDDAPLSSRERLLVAFLWILFFLLNQVAIVQRTVVGQVLSPFWCAVIPGFVLISIIAAVPLFGRRIYYAGFYAKAIVILVPIALVPLILSGMLYYHEDILSVLRTMYFLLSGLLLFPYLMLLKPRPRVIRALFNVLFVETTLVFILITLQISTGVPHFVDDFALRDIYTRAPVQILYKEGLLLVCFVLSSIGHSKSHRSKPWLLLLLSFLLYYTIFVWITRQVMIHIVVMLVAFVMILFRVSRGTFSKVVCGVIAIAILTVALAPSLLSGIVAFGDVMYSGVSYDLASGSGTLSEREAGIAYYGREFLKSGLVGFGAQHGGEDQVLTPEYSGFNLNDLGLLNTLFRYGFPAVVFVVVVLLRMEADLRKTIPHVPHRYNVHAYAVHLMVVTQIITLPFSTAFFLAKYNAFFALLMFYAWQLTTFYGDDRNGPRD